LLLAAGFSRRFGADKRLQLLADGAPLGLAAIDRWLAAEALDELYVATRPNDDFARLLRRSDRSCTLLPATNADLGMGHTLSNAVAQITPAWNCCLLIGLADMPLVSPATLNALALELKDQAEHQPGCIVVPTHHGQRGNPVGFGPAWRGALKACRGDQGARNILQAAQKLDTLHSLPTSDAGVLQDVDTSAQLDAIR